MNVSRSKSDFVCFCSCLCGAALIGLSYWLLSALHFPDEPTLIKILYRFGDSDYLPLIYSLARGQFTEFVDPESLGQGWVSFPIVTLLPYAFCIAVFGNAGFILADVLIAVCCYLLIYSILKTFADKHAMAAAIALAIFVGTYAPLGEGGWNFRYPRPYVTQLFLLGVALTSIHLVRQLRANSVNPYLAFSHGLLIGVSTQGDIHAAVGFGVATSLIFGGFVVSGRDWKLLARCSAAVAIGAALGVLPLLAQTLIANPEVLTRWGVYNSARGWTLLFVETRKIVLVGIIAVVPWMRATLPRLFQKPSDKEKDVALVLLALIGGALLAPLGSVALTGKSVQPYHFYYRLENAVTLGLFVTLAAALLSAKTKIWIVGLASIALAAYGTPAWIQEAQKSLRTSQQRTWNDDFPALQTYRTDLTRLMHELDHPRYQEAKVLGTFDQQIAMLWVTQWRHTLYIPDTFLSLVANEVIERRTIALCRLVGMNETEFLQKVQQPYFQIRFLSLAKWQANVDYVAGALDDYTADQLRNILRTRAVLDTWHLELPQSVRNHLRETYRLSNTTGLEPDLVILTDVVGYSHLPGPTDNFVLAYQNNSFRVYLRADL